MKIVKRALLCAGLLMSATLLNIVGRDASASPQTVRPLDGCSSCSSGDRCAAKGGGQCGCASWGGVTDYCN